jgi:hypothetical protein
VIISNISSKVCKKFIGTRPLLPRFFQATCQAFIFSCVASLYYTVNNLGVNTDTSTLLSQDLPFQKNRIRWENAFPQDAATIIFVVEAPTAEQTSIAANIL